jgi:hypothetical protein
MKHDAGVEAVRFNHGIMGNFSAGLQELQIRFQSLGSVGHDFAYARRHAVVVDDISIGSRRLFEYAVSKAPSGRNAL